MRALKTPKGAAHHRVHCCCWQRRCQCQRQPEEPSIVPSFHPRHQVQQHILQQCATSSLALLEQSCVGFRGLHCTASPMRRLILGRLKQHFGSVPLRCRSWPTLLWQREMVQGAGPLMAITCPLAEELEARDKGRVLRAVPRQ